MPRGSFHDLFGVKARQLTDFHCRQSAHNYKKAYKDFADSNAATDPADQYYDWVITCAFYAALHYLHSALSIDGACLFYKRAYSETSFEDILKDRRRNPGAFPEDAALAPHDVLKKIAYETYNEVSSEYDRLYSEAHTARYKQFRAATMQNAQDALGRLEFIRAWFVRTFQSQLGSAT